MIARIIDDAVVCLLMAPWLVVAAVLSGLGQIASDSGRREIAVAATVIIGAGVVSGACYEVWTSVIQGGVGKRAMGLRVVTAGRDMPMLVRSAAARWLLLVGPAPLVWLSLGVGGTSSDHRGLVRSLLVATLAWRTAIGFSVLATAGRGGLHDRIVHSRVVRAHSN